MRAGTQILPGTGRGTIGRMVEGHARFFRPLTVLITAACPSTSFAGPPPPEGADL